MCVRGSKGFYKGGKKLGSFNLILVRKNTGLKEVFCKKKSCYLGFYLYLVELIWEFRVDLAIEGCFYTLPNLNQSKIWSIEFGLFWTKPKNKKVKKPSLSERRNQNNHPSMENTAQFSRKKKKLQPKTQGRFDSLPALELIQSRISFTVWLLNHARVCLERDQDHPAEALLEQFVFVIDFAVFSPA